MAGKLTLDTLKKAAKNGEIDTVLTVMVDMQGRLMGKRMHVDFFMDSGFEETHSCNYLLATDMDMNTVQGYQSTGWAKGYGDYALKPDLETLRLIPWLDGTALVMCDVLDHHTHNLIPHAPRTILKHQVARLESLGFKALMASELEFFLFKESYEEAHQKGYQNLTPVSSYNEDYHIFQTTKEEGVMRAIRNGLNGADIAVENTKGEACAGQEEINVRYTNALNMADHHAIIKNGCKEIAWAKGQSISFMAKWHDDAAGNSSHIHQSITSLDGKPLFYEANAKYGMSNLMQKYLAGLMHNARDITYFLAPNINSYKRFSAETFAPTKAIWSMDNRTAGYRICGANSPAVRIECRVGGADLNPYLAMAALIAAGIDGIENNRTLEPEFSGDAYVDDQARDIPQTLRDAVVALDQSSILRRAMGDQVIDHYVHAGRWEQSEHDRQVTDWEINRGFERT